MADDADRTILNTRLIDAPRERVFGAFMDPMQLEQWFGPEGFTNTIKSFDARPGGKWHIVMHGPNGTDYPSDWAFVEIAKPERIVARHIGPMHDFTLDLTYAERDGQTELIWRQTFTEPLEDDAFRDFLNQANEQNFDRLSAHLAATA